MGNKKLTEVVDFVGGSQPPKTMFVYEPKEGYVRLIQIRDYKSENHIVYIPKNSTKKFCEADDIMIGRYGPPVFQILRGIKGAYNVALMKAKPKIKELDKNYLYWFLSNPSIQKYIIGISQRSAGQSGVNKKALEEYDIFLPPLPEQKRIVTKLDALFERIDKAIALLEENIGHTQALMDAVLGEVFDSLATKFSVSPLLEHIDFIGGSQPPKTKFIYEPREGYVRLIQIRDYKSDNHIVYIPKDSTRKFCEVDDIMIGRYGPPVFQILKGLNGAYNVALMKATPITNEISRSFLFWFLKSPNIQNYIIAISQRSAGQSGVNKKALETYEIVVPPLEIQESVSNNLIKLEQGIEIILNEQQQKLQSLHALKTSLLDKAFKGEL